MKKVIAIMILLVIVLTLFSPVKVFADINIDDTSEYVLNENQIIIGRKLATLDILENLLSNGVSSFSISNVSDVDTYLDDLWNEIEQAYDDGSISTEIVGNVIDWNGLSKLHYEIEKNTINYATQLNSAGLLLSGVNLLSDYFLNNDFKAPKKDIPVALSGLQFLSALSNPVPSPQPSPDFSFISNINNIICNCSNDSYNFFDISSYYDNWGGSIVDNTNIDKRAYSYFSDQFVHVINNITSNQFYKANDIISIYVTTGSTVNVLYSSFSATTFNNFFNMVSNPNQQATLNNSYSINYKKVSSRPTYPTITNGSSSYPNMSNYNRTSFPDISTAINYIYQHYANVNLYVDDVPWALTGNNISSSPNLDIDGILKLFGQNQPVTYTYPSDINIDYKKLYEVIYNAIQNGTPVSMDTITNNDTYIDSHDITYSPTIYNYYGDDSEQEQDYIETLINSATVPNFNQTYLVPLTEPLDSGIHTFYTSVSVIPEEILIIFGGLFVLLLFVCILNRMLE